ncbi:MAG: endonuclease/exonuclease/phosphatase family protein [Clostridia bacterium]|nr:endonuclease/exonuclease/phosphatase family protein [Clostridia bacterium]
MKILSLNVNNFGGTNNKPLLKDYVLSNGRYDFRLWNLAVDEWRSVNKTYIESNVDAICDLVCDYDVVFLHEVDTNCFSWHHLLRKMGTLYRWEPANGIEKNSYDIGRKSISCVFVKKGVDFEYKKDNFLDKERNVELKIKDTHIIGLHMSYDIRDWDKLIAKYSKIHSEEVIILGDLNVYDYGTVRREKFDELLDKGAIDIWLKQGGDISVPTANTNKRIDYALASKKMYEKGVSEKIIDSIRTNSYTDHAAIAVAYNE